MIQTKLISSEFDTDLQVNMWIRNNRHFEIIDIKFSIAGGDENVSRDALIIYNTKEEE